MKYLFGVQVNAAVTVKTVPFRRRFNMKTANWEQYAYQLDAAVENIPATAECYYMYQFLVSILQTAHLLANAGVVERVVLL